MCIETMRIQRSVCGALDVFAENTTFSKMYVSCSRGTFLDRVGREGKMDVRRASKGPVGKGRKNIPGEEGAEAKPQLVVVRDAWPLLGHMR